MRIVDGIGSVWGEVDYRPQGNFAAQVFGGAYPLLGSYWVRDDAFFAAGGFDRSFGGADDVHLPIRLSLLGDFATIPEPVACLLRGTTWSTSGDYSRSVEEVRLIRDAALALPKAYGRLQDSATTAYWKGRLAHVYTSSCLLNLRRGHWLEGLSRAFHTGRAMASAGTSLFSVDYWRGVVDHQIPGSLYYVMKRIEQASSDPSLEG